MKTSALFCISLFTGSVLAAQQQQQPFLIHYANVTTPVTTHGRYLHITDIHVRHKDSLLFDIHCLTIDG